MSKEINAELIVLKAINEKLDKLLILSALTGLDVTGKKRLLKNYKGTLSKRELENLTGIDRHGF